LAYITENKKNALTLWGVCFFLRKGDNAGHRHEDEEEKYSEHLALQGWMRCFHMV
jgi:hypothetical protein